jgi:hypothetical protein
VAAPWGNGDFFIAFGFFQPILKLQNQETFINVGPDKSALGGHSTNNKTP